MSELLKPEQIPELLDRFRPQKILLLAHLRPDGDAIGSLCAALLLLRKQGFQADAVVSGSDIPDACKPFLPAEGLKAEPEIEPSDYGLFVVLDSSRRDRISASFAAAEEKKLPAPMLVIDHHPDNPCYGEWNCIVPEAAATSEILADIAFRADWTMPEAAATLLLLGILTDSGSFRFSNTSARTLRAASALMEAGGEYFRVMDACFFSKPENMARFEADLLCNHLKKACGGKFIYTFFRPELLEKYRIELRNTEQVIEILRAIAGPVIAATIRIEAGGFKCSLRSKDRRYSVGRIARAVGGGGHEMAAGCTIHAASFEEAERILLENVEKELL